MSLHFLIQRPVAVLTVLVGLLALGAVVSTTLPVSLLPDLSIPQISVQISRAGTGAAELERTVTSALRNQLLQVNRLKDISSSSQDEQATITLDFEFGTNINLAFIEVNEKIDQIVSQLPKDLERPSVLKAGVTDIPVFYLAVVPKSGSPLELSTFSKTVLKRRMEQLPQIAFVDRSGYATPQITLQPNAAIMQRLGLTIQDVERLLTENNINFGSVLVQDGQYQYNIRLSNQLGALEDIAALPISHEGQVIPLSKLASLRLDIQPRRGLFQYNGKEAIVFAIRKQADAQLFDMKKTFAELLNGLEKDYPNLQFYVFNDQSDLLEVSIDNLRTSLGWGALFTILVMFLAYRGWRVPVLIGLTVPTALVLSLLGFYLLDISINIISLSGLILGVGLMIDNSIIVIDNIYQYRAMGLDWTEACAKGANEVIRPLISSALTTCCVFLPLVFLSGIAGALFYDQAMSITIALIASLLVAYIPLPTLLQLIGKNQKSMGTEATKTPAFFTKSVDVVLRRRWLFSMLFLLLLLFNYFPLQQLTRQTFPALTRNAYTIKVDWNEPISVEENQLRTATLIKQLGNTIKQHTSFIGEQQFLLSTSRKAFNQTETIVSLSENSVLPTGIIESYLKENYPQAKYEIKALETIFDQVFGAPKPPLVVHLQLVGGQEAPGIATLMPFLEFLKGEGVSVALPATQTQYEVRILREKALLYEVPLGDMFNILQIIVKNYNIGTLKTSSEQIPIVVTGESQSFSKALQTAFVTNTKGETVPLSHFIELEKTETYKSVSGGKGGVAIDVALPMYSDELLVNIKNYLKQDGTLTAYFSGQHFEDQQLLKELVIVLMISLLLLYLILAAQFESLIQPLIVLSILPIALLGALMALWCSGQTVNLVSAIGIIVMAGIAVNDTILKVDTINILKKNMPLLDAIHEAGTKRLLSILMTSITTILALVPVLFASGLGAELQQPLAYAVIGGLTMSTVSSLYFVPLFYIFVYGSNKKTTSTTFN